MLSFREPLPQRLSHAATDTPGSSGLREARWEIKEYVMKVVCAFSFLKTEAFSTVDATIHASSLSVLTCPIIPAPASSIPAIVLTVTNVPEASITHPCVRLCLQCRQDLFEKHPEKLIPSVEGSDKIRITRHRAISKYVLEGPEILISNALSAFAEENPSITPDLGHHLPHREVLQTARRVHGGQVGVEAILSCGMGKAKIVSSLQREALFRSEWAALSSAS
ncbi:hypothetical protein BGZ58_002606 [Dissophora ornata]|nr:hypothetical protein BGZ58_002606 [Dissophora ornata]